MSVEDYQVSFSFDVNITDQTLTTIRQAQMLLFRTASLMRRMGLPEPIDAAISKMQRAVVVANQLRIAMLALQAASGPLGWALAALGLATFAFTAGDFMAEVSSG